MYKNGIPTEYLTRQFHPIQSTYRMQNEIRMIQPDQPSELSKMEQELAGERERYLRLAADFDNYRKRTARELERRASSQKDAFVRDLLPAVDNLERAMAANHSEHLREGVEMICQQLIETLKRHGLEPRDDLGQPFDGRFHDAIAVGSRSELPDLCVMEVWERGWMRGGEMFRPAKVLVNKLEPESSAAPKEQLLAKN